MNQSAKQPVGTSKCTRPEKDLLQPGGGGGLQMDRNDQTTGMIKGFFGV